MRLAVRLVLALCLVGAPGALRAQDGPQPDAEETVRSMGLPPLWKPHVGAMVDTDRDGEDTDAGAEVLLGVYRDLVNPLYGLGIVGEGYYRNVGGRSDSGLRLLGSIRSLGLAAGADRSLRDDDWSFLMSLQLPLRRGGPLGRGGALRIDWFPNRDHSFNIGLTLPLGQPWLGRSRPRSDNVRLPRAALGALAYEPGPDLREALGRVQHAAVWINRFTTPFFDQDGKTDEEHMAAFLAKVTRFKAHIQLRDALHPDGHTFASEIEAYHRELERAFGLASRGDREDGARIATRARQVLLDQVILPYNRLLGQRKTRDSLRGFGAAAEREFADWLASDSGFGPDARAGARYVFRALVGFADEARAGSRSIWGDSRLVWLPLHMAVRPEDCDTQRELDALLEKATGEQFTDANEVHYVVNELFQPELGRMIHRTEDYHVLWIHDFRGMNSAGDPDRIGYRMAVEGYLHALTRGVRAYEETKKLPVYLIFLDQFFFEVNDGRGWMELLESPLEHEVDLPPAYAEWEQTLRSAQDELRAAVAASPTLQAGARRYGRRWLTDRIKVHVNITNPADPSFRSRHLIEYVPFVPDNLLRDHRKIAFRDVTELDPAKGEALYTGMGVGEHYSGPTWDDRALLVRGPALLPLKDAARELLLSQGFQESEIPAPLRPRPRPPDYADRVAALRSRGWTDSVLEVHNATGYGPKDANAVKATLYNLMPSGSHLYVPDSLWNSPHWGGMLVGAALRGCRVFVVSPALENAPSAGIPQMSRANEVFTRFVVIQDQMSPEIEAEGGLFRVGIYNRDVDVGDIPAEARAVAEGVAQADFFLEEFPFDPSVYRAIEEMKVELRARGFQPAYLAEDVEQRKPKLHFKAQFFASPEALAELIPLPSWAPLMRSYLEARAEQTRRRETAADAKDLRAALAADAERIVDAWGDALSPRDRERLIYYLVIGSHNQDYRGKIMDGEVLVAVSRAEAMIAYLDFVHLLALTTWVKHVDEVDALLPSHSGFWRWVGRHIRNAL